MIKYHIVTHKLQKMTYMDMATSRTPYEHPPTLNTVIMVEEVLRNMDESAITVAELKRRLPKKVNHNKLKTILRYLEESNKIALTVDGITWIFNPNPNLRKAVSKGFEL